MPLIPTVTIKNISKHKDTVTVSANLSVKNGGVGVIDSDFSASFRPGLDDPKKHVEERLYVAMKAKIDELNGGDVAKVNPKILALKSNLEARLVK